jgi:hypothetical protein
MEGVGGREWVWVDDIRGQRLDRRLKLEDGE